MYFPLTQDGQTPLCIASENAHSDVVNILIGNGADVNLSWKVCIYTEGLNTVGELERPNL